MPEAVRVYSSIKNELVITDLEKGTLYDFRVAAINELGESQFGELSQFQTKKGILKLESKFLDFCFTRTHRLGESKTLISNDGLTLQASRAGNGSIHKTFQ